MDSHSADENAEASETKDLSEAALSCRDIVARLQSSPIAINLREKKWREH